MESDQNGIKLKLKSNQNGIFKIKIEYIRLK